MSKPTKESIIRWMRMIGIKDCKKNKCPCSDKLRRLIIRKPVSLQDEKWARIDIKEFTKKYNECYNSAIIIQVYKK